MALWSHNVLRATFFWGGGGGVKMEPYNVLGLEIES